MVWWWRRHRALPPVGWGFCPDQAINVTLLHESVMIQPRYLAIWAQAPANLLMATEGQRSPQAMMLRTILLWSDHLHEIRSSSQQEKWVRSLIPLRRPANKTGLPNLGLAPDLHMPQVRLRPSSQYPGHPSPYSEILRQARRGFAYWRSQTHLQQVRWRRGGPSPHRGANQLQERRRPAFTSTTPQKKRIKTKEEILSVLRPD